MGAAGCSVLSGGVRIQAPIAGPKPKWTVDPMLFFRPEIVSDGPGIDGVLRVCFSSPAEAQLVAALRASQNLSVSLVALWSDRIIGHCACSPVSMDAGELGLGIGPVAVIPDYRRQGIAAQLVKLAILASQHAGCAWMVVLGDPSYYKRFGFRPASCFTMRSIYGDGDYFQAMALREHGLPRQGGMVSYRQEFANCGC